MLGMKPADAPLNGYVYILYTFKIYLVYLMQLKVAKKFPFHVRFLIWFRKD